MKNCVSSDRAPKALGPYSIAVKTDNLVYTSGQVGIDPATNELVSGGIEVQTRRVLDNLKIVLECSGSGMEHVIKTTVFLSDIADFATVNGIYGEYFTTNYPARSAIQVCALPKNALVEIEAVAILP